MKTKLMQVLDAHAEYQRLVSETGNVQTALDVVATDVCRGGSLSAEDIVDHMALVYNMTAPVYAANKEHESVPDALFMMLEWMPDGGQVLDYGCGTGRDAVFMALTDREKRMPFMGRVKDGKTAFQRFGSPDVSCKVLGVDISEGMITHAKQLALASGLCDGPNPEATEFWVLPPEGDMHSPVSFSALEGYFDGVWSSAALFMHTPEEHVAPSLARVSAILKPGGVFGVSYANNSTGLSYDNLRHSRTGEIKYFSRPSPRMIEELADKVDLALVGEQYSDLEMAGKVQKNFFVTQFFMKV